MDATRGPWRRRPALLSLCTCLVTALVALAGTAHADEEDALRDRADRLRAQNAELDEAASRTLLELYALEASLGRAERRVDALRAEQAELEERRQAARRHIELAKRAEAQAQSALAERVRALYVEGGPEPLEVILGSTTLEGVVDAIDTVNRVSEHDERIVAQVHATRGDLRDALDELTRREAQLEQLTRRAEEARARLAQARDGKESYLAGLVAERSLNDGEIADLLERAGAAEARSAEIEEDMPPAPEPAPSGPEPAPQPASGGSGDGDPGRPGRQVTVTATMYCLKGTTATGIPVGPGVVATDPAYIPLGTRMEIPGYGTGIAADTGGAVIGWFVDMWVASCAQASAYGKRTITITLFD